MPKQTKRKRKARRKSDMIIEGSISSPIEIAASSIAALAQAIDSRMQGRKLLKELGSKMDNLSAKIDGLGSNLGGKMDTMLDLQKQTIKILDERLPLKVS